MGETSRGTASVVPNKKNVSYMISTRVFRTFFVRGGLCTEEKFSVVILRGVEFFPRTEIGLRVVTELRNKVGTTKVQPGAQSAAGAVGAEVITDFDGGEGILVAHRVANADANH